MQYRKVENQVTGCRTEGPARMVRDEGIHFPSMHELKQLTTLEELKSAVATTATGKTSCLDGIPVDPLKSVKHIVPFLYSVLC
ncbi:unnamed protein product [Clavelina lepadiformis]|uniref:Uncharacterized protein n=1 Tax=Clavelina lepadiformis TaxID=159417 RepID=A0ABP0FK22_CLALP